MLSTADKPLAADRVPAAARGCGLIVNADDWGCDVLTTDRAFDCFLSGNLSSVSAMVFMADSERAAYLAAEHGVDAGLHLNLTAPFTASCRGHLRDHQARLAGWLRSNRLAPAIYRPDLRSSFEFVVQQQLSEFERLYGRLPARVDGHHHMHLCSNVVFQKLLPEGAIVRRNFTFRRGEKSIANRSWRNWQDRRLARRHRMTDYFFALPPIDVPGRLEAIGSLATSALVELETHPVRADEYAFLIEGNLRRHTCGAAIARGYKICGSGQAKGMA